MINPKDFFNILKNNGIDFFTGVPDSLMKSILFYISSNVSTKNHIIAANEGGAIGLGLGYHLATGKIPLVYMQNSGIGNATNPILSLADKEIYGIPMLLMIGWRGEPSKKDEPQHIKQGRVTLDLLRTMEIPYEIIDGSKSDYDPIIKNLIKKAYDSSNPVAMVIKKNTFDNYSNDIVQIGKNAIFNREEAIKIIVDNLDPDDIIVSTTGKASRELFEYREEKKQGHDKDFLTVGGMGHASQIALGIAIKKPDKRVFCFDGDGAAILHMGGMGIIGSSNVSNYIHIILNNETHDSVGGQPTIGNKIDFCKIANGLGYNETISVYTKEDLTEAILKCKAQKKLSLIEIKIKKGARKNLGRPTTTPFDNKIAFMQNLNET